MATAKKLPSGSYRVRAYDKATGKYKSFTAGTKREAELMAAEWLNGRAKRCNPEKITVKEAVQNYIESKEGVLSPASVRGYYIIYRNAIDQIADMNIGNIRETDLQIWISQNAKKYAPKTVENQYGLVSAALRQNKIDLDFDSILLPKLIQKEVIIPNEQQVCQILHIVENTSIELPVTMAITLGLRQSEIAAVKWSDYDGQRLYIHAAMVPNKNHKMVEKSTTKSAAGTRVIEVGELLKTRLDRAKHKSEYISPLKPYSVLVHFHRLCEKNGLPKFTMHAQRHGNASIMLANHVPDKYAMQRLGQSSPNMIKNVYQHLYGEKIKQFSDEISDVFSDIYDTKHDTNNDKQP